MAVTRPRDPSGAEDRLARLVRDVGGIPVHHPLTRIVPAADPEPLRRAAAVLAGPEPAFDVVLLTSRRAIPPLVAALRAAGIEPAELRRGGVEIWAVGEATGRAASAAGLGVDRVPDRFVGEALLEGAARWRRLEGLRILFPRAAEVRAQLPDGLSRAGAVVTSVESYASEPDAGRAVRLAAEVSDGGLAVVTLTAGSAARALAAGWRSRRELAWPRAVPIVAIGPATAEAASAVGLPVAAMADPHTLEGVAARVAALLGPAGGGSAAAPAPASGTPP